jgi:hypothetical protein
MLLGVSKTPLAYPHEIATDALIAWTFGCSQRSHTLANNGRQMFAVSSRCPPASLLLVSRFIALLKTGLDVENRCPKRLALCSGVQDERDNQAV